MNLAPLIPPGRDRRRAGNALIVYGVVGVLLLGGLMLATLLAAVRIQGAVPNYGAARDEVVTVIDSVIASLDAADTTLTGLGTTLTETSAVIDEAATLSGILSDSAQALSEGADTIGFLGQYPFAGFTEPLAEASASLARLAEDLAAASVSVTANAVDVQALGASLGTVADSLEASRDRLAAIDLDLGLASTTTVGVLLVLIGWLMVPAVAALWVGRRWRRENPPAP